ncbi:MAG: Hsp20/alpha crystallin family protein [Sedimentisphaerales bacterium]|nr:Hsp20/alpha crystallin family protein [Sedimentisphaerales bacterium]
MLAKVNRRNALPALSRGDWFGWDKFFDDFFRTAPRELVSCQNLGNLDVYEDETHLHVEAELPGFTKDQISLTLEDGVLHLQAERSEEKTNQDEKNQYYVRERSSGKWARSVRLPIAVQEKNVKASFADGVLKVSLEKAEEKKAHRIQLT